MLLSRGVPLLTAVLAWGAIAPSAQAQQMPCMNEIAPLRQAVEKAGAAIKAAADKKAERSEICSRIKTFVAQEAKFIKYIETNAAKCGIPAQVGDQMKAGHKNTEAMATKVCNVAQQMQNQPRGPAGPSLSEVLGSGSAPEANAGKKGGSTFDTLNGNVLTR